MRSRKALTLSTSGCPTGQAASITATALSAEAVIHAPSAVPTRLNRWFIHG